MSNEEVNQSSDETVEDDEQGDDAGLVDVNGEEFSEKADEEKETDESDTDEKQEERVIPELEEDVYRAPFSGYNTSDPEEVAEAVGEMNKEAAKLINQLVRELDEAKQQAESYKEELNKNKQEFRQYKRRKDSEKQELKQTASKSLIKKALPIRDNLSRAIQQDKEKDIFEGIKLVRDEFDKLLETEGVEVVNPDRGDMVDPEYHEVMARVESEDVESGQVTSCYLPGFVLNDTVIREAKVNVSD